jgi:UDP-GlcNAc:undecaprenyl-phosphate GlcNAc-1-phosphate transferase
MTEWQDVTVAGGAALALSLAFVPIARQGALRLGVTDRPGSGKVHKVPTPYLGGVAVAVAVLCTAPIGEWRGEVVAILGAALLVSCIGLVDDVRTSKPSVRVAVEIVAAVIVFSAGARVNLFGGVADLALTIAWLVVITNAYNLLDNMDACASSILAVSAGSLLVAAVLQEQVLVGSLAAAVTGAAAGFLVYNWHPARIFLGDAGSLFLGFLVSAVALKLRFPVDQGAGVVAVLLVAFPALFDTTLVVISRILAGRPIYIGGTDHTSHRLALLGLPTRGIALLLVAVTAACGGFGVAVGRGVIAPFAVVAPLAVAAGVVLIFFLRIPVYAQGSHRAPAEPSTPVFAKNPEVSAVDA